MAKHKTLKEWFDLAKDQAVTPPAFDAVWNKAMLRKRRRRRRVSLFTAATTAAAVALLIIVFRPKEEEELSSSTIVDWNPPTHPIFPNAKLVSYQLSDWQSPTQFLMDNKVSATSSLSTDKWLQYPVLQLEKEKK